MCTLTRFFSSKPLTHLNAFISTFKTLQKLKVTAIAIVLYIYIISYLFYSIIVLKIITKEILSLHTICITVYYSNVQHQYSVYDVLFENETSSNKSKLLGFSVDLIMTNCDLVNIMEKHVLSLSLGVSPWEIFYLLASQVNPVLSPNVGW